MKDWSKKILQSIYVTIIALILPVIWFVVRYVGNIMIEDIISLKLEEWGWNPQNFLSSILDGINNHPWRATIIYLLIIFTGSLICHFIPPILEKRKTAPIEIELEYSPYNAGSRKFGIYVTNQSQYIIENFSAQIHTIHLPNRQKPTEVNLTLVWAENNKGEISLQSKRPTSLLIAEGKLRESYSVLLTTDKEDWRFDIGESIIVLKFFGQVGTRSIIPISQKFNLLNGGDGVFNIEELNDC